MREDGRVEVEVEERGTLEEVTTGAEVGKEVVAIGLEEEGVVPKVVVVIGGTEAVPEDEEAIEAVLGASREVVNALRKCKFNQ